MEQATHMVMAKTLMTRFHVVRFIEMINLQVIKL